MKRMIVGLRLLVIGVLVLGLAGCPSLSSLSGSDNTITTTTTGTDGTTKTVTETFSDATMHGKQQVEAVKAQKPVMLIEADESKEIKITGIKRWELYASSGQPTIRQYQAAWERVFINGMSLAAMVVQGYINADMAKSIVNTLGALKTNQTYTITTQDGSPVNIAGGNITNGAVTITQSPTTTTTTTTTGTETGTTGTTGTGTTSGSAQ